MLRTLGDTRISGLLDGADHQRINEHDVGKFVPDNIQLASVPVKINWKADIAETILDNEILADVYGGKVAVTLNDDNKMVPAGTWFRISFVPRDTEKPYELSSVTRGVVVLSGTPESFLARISRRVLSVLIRESGF